MGRRFMDRLRVAAEGDPRVGDVRGKGLMVGIEFVRPGGNEPAPETASLVQENCRALGLLVGKGGLYGNVLRIAPPLTVSSDEIDRAAAALEETLAATRRP
jgi:4-aminobutyrate aminotransferase